jgi:hypothetical protein
MIRMRWCWASFVVILTLILISIVLQVVRHVAYRDSMVR